MTENTVLIRGRLCGDQQKRLPRILDMTYTPGQIAAGSASIPRRDRNRILRGGSGSQWQKGQRDLAFGLGPRGFEVGAMASCRVAAGRDNPPRLHLGAPRGCLARVSIVQILFSE